MQTRRGVTSEAAPGSILPDGYMPAEIETEAG